MIGILQGRLTHPWNGQLQCFPRGAWQEEFRLAGECGFAAIELLAEKEFNAENPIWSPEGRAEMAALAAETGISAPIVCADCFMTTPLTGGSAVSLPLLNELLGLGFKGLVLPFFEAAELRGNKEIDALATVVDHRAESETELLIETSLPAAKVAAICDHLHLGVCYDLGNTTALGYDNVEEIGILGKRIRHVHVKDKRRSDGANVLLGTGDVNLPAAFEALRHIGYQGDFTLETARGADPVAQAREHLAFVSDLVG